MFKTGIQMNFLQSSLVFILAISITSAATPPFSKISKFSRQNMETIDIGNGMTAMVIPIKGDNGDNAAMLNAVVDTFNPGARTAVCPFSPDDIQSISHILTDAIAYLYGLIDGNNNDPEITAQREELLKKQIKVSILAPSYIKFIKNTENQTIEIFLHNLLFIHKTVVYNLDQPDEKIRDSAYRQLIKEIANVNKWFETSFNFNALNELNILPWVQSVSIIFSDLNKYFPSNNIGSGNIFQMANGKTRIDEMDEQYEIASAAVKITIISYTKRAQQKKATLKNMENYFNSTLKQPLGVARVALEKAIKPLLLPVVINDDIRRKMKEEPREAGLRRRVITTTRRPVTPKPEEGEPSPLQGAKDLDDNSIEKRVINAHTPPQTHIAVSKPESLLVVEAAAASAPEPVVERQHAKPDEDSQESDFSPQKIHAMHQARKQEERRTSPQPEEAAEKIVHNPEFYAFLRDTVYGTSQFTWEIFLKAFKKAGFEIVGAGGNVRRVFLTGTNLKFTVHEPAKDRDPMAHKYVSFIRSGLERVFGLSESFVTKFK